MSRVRAPSVQSRGGLVAVFALVACWSSAAPTSTTPVGNAGGGDPMIAANAQQGIEGQYWCAITSTSDLGKFEYPKFQCTISREDGRLVLAKLGGSQRFTGEIAALGSDDGRTGFRFAGQFYCPWGSCTQALHGEFRPGRDGAFTGRFTDDTSLHVRLWRAAPNEFAGVGYGGAGYGGLGYGGAMYGGRTYGGGGRYRMHRPH